MENPIFLRKKYDIHVHQALLPTISLNFVIKLRLLRYLQI